MTKDLIIRVSQGVRQCRRPKSNSSELERTFLHSLGKTMRENILSACIQKRNAHMDRCTHTVSMCACCLPERACMHSCMRACMLACMHAYIPACMHACAHACVHSCMHACSLAPSLLRSDRRHYHQRINSSGFPMTSKDFQ